MIDTELENESVILKCQTINTQPAFGKPATPQARTFNRRILTIRYRVPAKP